MASRAAAAPTAQRQQLVKAVVADRFHHGQPRARLDRRLFSSTIDHNQLGHDSQFLSCATYPRVRRAANQSAFLWQAGRSMGISAEAIRSGLDEVAAREPGIARALEIAGY